MEDGVRCERHGWESGRPHQLGPTSGFESGDHVTTINSRLVRNAGASIAAARTSEHPVGFFPHSLLVYAQNLL